MWDEDNCEDEEAIEKRIAENEWSRLRETTKSQAIREASEEPQEEQMQAGFDEAFAAAFKDGWRSGFRSGLLRAAEALGGAAVFPSAAAEQQYADFVARLAGDEAVPTEEFDEAASGRTEALLAAMLAQLSQ